MNIGNKLGQFNIAHAGNVLNANLANKMPVVKPDSFQKGLYTTAPKRTSVSNNSTIPINNIYSPKQLLNAYSNPTYAKFLVDTNPNIKNMLANYGVEAKIYPENIRNISNSHLTTTTAFALQIANKMGISQADKQILEQACVFHDFGKILIPKEIIDKPAALTDSEKQIMNLHSDLGYELLSSTGMNERVLNLVKNHHNAGNNTDILGQILSVADIYSALREERSYKKALSEKDALALLDQKAQSGEVSTEVVNALKASLNTSSVNAA